MYKAIFYTFVAVSIAVSPLVPSVALAQYGGGGGLISGPLSIGFSAPAAVSTTPAPSPSIEGGRVLGASAYNFTKRLTLKSRGTDVTELQKILISLGLLNIATPTGWYGPMTTRAVKAYQTAHGLEAVGEVGPKTREQLNKEGTPVSVAPRGVVGWVSNSAQQVAKGIGAVFAWSAQQ